MSPRILAALGLLSASCGGATDGTKLTPSVSLDSTIQNVYFDDAEAFAFEMRDDAGIPYYSVFVSSRDIHLRCAPGRIDYDKGRSGYSLRFIAGPNPIDRPRPGREGFFPLPTWIPDLGATENYVDEESTAGTAISRRAEGDHVEVEADLVFPSGSVRGTVVATICR